MKDTAKMKENTLYVERGTYGSSNNDVIWLRGKPLNHDKYYYINTFEGNDTKANLLELFAEIEWWRKLGYDIEFDNFLNEEDLKELEETKERLENEEE